MNEHQFAALIEYFNNRIMLQHAISNMSSKRFLTDIIDLKKSAMAAAFPEPTNEMEMTGFEGTMEHLDKLTILDK